ncbi:MULTISPECIES: TetR/AcrR family transcriptional regulator [unclassified Streptomyces]|uniref:TetR/AcrR family transcriptional regulator n=1 Tax=unclassified Streptomyces TaxID=2593676 RepID=UPI00343337D7
MEKKTDAGERLLAAASELFYAQGIGAVGVDAVVARSGVSKPTLYAQFGSKDGLVAAVLDRRRWTRQQALTEFLDGLSSGPEEKLLAVFDWLALGHAKPGFRGCPFTNAAVELPDAGHPARAVILAYKTSLRTTLAGLAADAGLADPEELGSDLLLLIDGANARVVHSGDHTAMRRAGSAAARLIAAARTPRGQDASAPDTRTPKNDPEDPED